MTMEKERLLFACAWSKDKETSWSGTHLGLLKSLRAHFRVEEFDTGYANNKGNLLVTLADYMDKIQRRIFHRNDFSMRRMKVFNRLIAGKYPSREMISFQFDECPCLPNMRSYIYQDLHVGYVKKMFETMPELFKVSGYQANNRKAIDTREKYQRRFYATAEGVFTMGHWLSKELRTAYGIDGGKVHPVGGVLI